jgi:hypothetical protein
VPKRGFLPLLDNIETIRMKKMQKKCAVFPLVEPKNKGEKGPKNVKIF